MTVKVHHRERASVISDCLDVPGCRGIGADFHHGGLLRLYPLLPSVAGRTGWVLQPRREDDPAIGADSVSR